MSTVGKIVGKLGNLFRSKWHRELIGAGLEGKDGSLTDDGRNVVIRLFADKVYNESYTDAAGTAFPSMRQFIGEGLVKRNAEIAKERDER